MDDKKYDTSQYETSKINYDYDYNYEYSRRKKEQKQLKRSIVLIALVCSLLGAVIGSAITSMFLGGSTVENSSEQNVVINTNEDLDVATAVSEKAIPSVVGITTKGEVRSVFGKVETSGTGSGIIVDKEGYILTNAHVVKIGEEVSEKVTVLLNDGTSNEGKPIWVDPTIDVAIVKINPTTKLVPATLGDSSKLKVGETAIAIGNPIDMVFQRSVSKGIISGLNRYIGQVSGGGYMTGLIQTDATINGGNSGGPLLNAKGEVVGINTVKVSTAEGLGFSIPINSVKPIVEQVIKTGDYKVVSLGVQYIPASLSDIERYFGIDLGVEEGVLVSDVIPNSAASEAGLQKSDVIVKINDDKIQTGDSLKVALYKYSVGDTVKITYVRDKKEQTLDLTFKQFSKGTENTK